MRDFSQLFGPYGQRAFFDSHARTSTHSESCIESPTKKLLILVGLGIQIGRFNMLLPLQPCSTQKLFLPEGGDTLFANTANAYDDLNDVLKERD